VNALSILKGADFRRYQDWTNSTSSNDDHVQRFRAVVHGNRHLTLLKVAGELGINVGS
jgi:hypothetical protein